MKHNKKRLIISTGCYSTITAVAKLMDDNSADDYLWLISAIKDDDFISTNRSVAKQIWDFKKIGFSSGNEYDFDEIFIPYFLIEAQDYVLKNKKAKIIWYDEGLGSYNPVVNDGLYKRFAKRVKEVALLGYGGLFECFLFPKVKHSKIKKQNVLKVITKLQSVLSEDFSMYEEGNNILYIEQNYHDYNLFSRDETVKTSAKNISNLIGKGYNVIYKEHFRTKDKIFDDIKSLVQSDKLTKIECKLPLETYVEKLNLKAVVSKASSAGFNLSYFFGIPAFSFDVEPLLKSMQPKNSVGCFSAFTNKLYVPNISLMQEDDFVETYEEYQKFLPVSTKHPLLLMKYISAYRFLASYVQYRICKNLELEQLDSAFFTDKDKNFLSEMKKQTYFTYFIYYWLDRVFGHKILKDIRRFVEHPSSYSLQVLVIRIWKKLIRWKH